MKGVDPLKELENMAMNVTDEFDGEQGRELSDDSISRWQRLFCYPQAEAIDHITRYWSNLSRRRVSHEHWEMVRYEKGVDGFDREAYEHEIELGRSMTSKELRGLPVGPFVGQASSNSTYITKLGGPLDAAGKVQEAASLEAAPAILTGSGDLGDANFVNIDSRAKDAILVCLFKNGIDFAPTFVRVSKSGKNLSQHTMYPTLCLDSTLLQYRADSIDTKFLPAQDQYPMWYFFYGKLAVSDILNQLIALPDLPFFRPVSVTRGFIKKWREIYSALLGLSG